MGIHGQIRQAVSDTACLINKRNELKLSLRNAAELIGISHSYLNTLEKGIDPRNNAPIKPTPETLQLISKAYDVPYEYLMKLEVYLVEKSYLEQVLEKKEKKDIEDIYESVKNTCYEKSEGLMLSDEPLSLQSYLPVTDGSIIEKFEFNNCEVKFNINI